MKHIVCVLLAFLIMNNVFSQGCSDAGFCTIGAIKAGPVDSLREKKNKVSALGAFGLGDQHVFVFTPALQYEYLFGIHWTFQVKITSNYANGNLGNALGFGDIFFSTTYLLLPKKKYKDFLTIGTKLPLSAGDIRSRNGALPMQYQSSLGTIDLIVGYSFKWKKLMANAAWQQPISGSNQNTFLPANENSEFALGYSPSNRFKRKADVLLRVGYQILTKERFNLNVTALGIYHVGEDTYVDASKQSSEIKISGSKGLTLNLTTLVSYKINSRVTISISGGAPLLVRQVRPDGLTRAFSLSPQIDYAF
jgi:hypothetical protein